MLFKTNVKFKTKMNLKILTNTRCNSHIYIEKFRRLHVSTYDRKNTRNFLLSDFDVVKSCINRVETANALVGLQWLWHHLLVLLLEEIAHFTTKKVCTIQFVTRVCNHYLTLTLQIAKLHIYNGKSVTVRSWNIVRGKVTKIPELE